MCAEYLYIWLWVKKHKKHKDRSFWEHFVPFTNQVFWGTRSFLTHSQVCRACMLIVVLVVVLGDVASILMICCLF